MIRAAAIACVLAGAGCSQDDGGPRLTAVAPASAPQNSTVTLTGTRLCGASGDCSEIGATIALGIDPPMVDATIVSYTDTSAQFTVPTIVPTGMTSVIVTVGDQSSNALTFDILPLTPGQ